MVPRYLPEGNSHRRAARYGIIRYQPAVETAPFREWLQENKQAYGSRWLWLAAIQRWHGTLHRQTSCSMLWGAAQKRAKLGEVLSKRKNLCMCHSHFYNVRIGTAPPPLCPSTLCARSTRRYFRHFSHGFSRCIFFLAIGDVAFCAVCFLESCLMAKPCVREGNLPPPPRFQNNAPYLCASFRMCQFCAFCHFF